MDDTKPETADLPLLGAYQYTFSINRFIRFLGPGLLMSIAYIDPGNLESDLQVGAHAGYKLLWILWWSTVLGYVVQMQAAKLGVVTGKHLAEHCRQHFSVFPRTILWILAELAIIGSDIQEVIGSAIALLILSQGAIPLWAGVVLSAVASFLLLLVERYGMRSLEALFGAMIAVMVATFAYMYCAAGVPALEVVQGFITPRVPRANIPQAVALIGSLVMPHNIYLHSALVQTRRLAQDTREHRQEALMYYGLESGLSLLVSVFINMFVTCVFAAGFYGRGEDEEIGLANAGQYLGERFGVHITYIWALGLLAAGQSSTMTGCYTGQFVMSGYLKIQLPTWLRVLLTRAVALVPTLAVALLSQDATALDQLTQWLNLLQSLQLPFALIPVLAFNSSRALMGDFVNGRRMTLVAGLISLVVTLVNILGVYSFMEAVMLHMHTPAMVALVGGVLLYVGFICYLFVHTAWVSGVLPGFLAEPTPAGYLPLPGTDALQQQQQQQQQLAPEGATGVGPSPRGNAPHVQHHHHQQQQQVEASPFARVQQVGSTEAVDTV